MQVCLTFGIPKEVVTTKGVSNNAPRNFLLWFSEIVDINHSVGKVYCIVGMLDTKKNNKQTKKVLPLVKLCTAFCVTQSFIRETRIKTICMKYDFCD